MLAKTTSSASATRTTSPFVVSSSPTFSIRFTPAAAAASSSSAVGFSQRKRWVWESITRPRLWAGEGRQRRGDRRDRFQGHRKSGDQFEAAQRSAERVY